MEPDVSVESGCMIRVVVVAIGQMPGAFLRDYISMVVKHTSADLSNVRSFYTEHQKSPFARQPWTRGSLRFKFLVGGAMRSPWEDFQAQRTIHGLIGLCHCPTSPDIGAAYDQFVAVSKAYPSVLAKRCFAFYPSDDQVEQEEKKRQKLILFPPVDLQTLEHHMQTLMHEFAASLLMEFESRVLHAEAVGAILTTPLDVQSSLGSEEVSKAKRRKLGRAQKTIGDYCLLAGSPLDADAHYSTAVELARLTGDAFWHAGALEGSICALVVDSSGQTDAYVIEDLKLRYEEIIKLYRRATALTFELEAILKFARFLCGKDYTKDVVELLTGAIESSKSLIDPSDKLVVNVEVARIFGSLGYERKAAFFCRQVAQLYLQQDSKWASVSALQVLALAANSYSVQGRSMNVKGIDASDATPQVGTCETGKELCPWMNCSLGQWNTLQMDVLGAMLLAAVRAGDPLAAWSAAARLLRGHYPLITPSDQSSLASALTSSAERLPLGTRCCDPALPFVRFHSFPNPPSQMEIVKRTKEKKEWWAGSAPSGPFIYTPFVKGGDSSDEKVEVIWVVGEAVQVLVDLANPCSFQVCVENIYLSVEGGKFEAHPFRVTLPPNSLTTVSLSGIPLSVGTLTVRGCFVKCFGVVSEHLFEEIDELLADAAKGLTISDPFRTTGGLAAASHHYPKTEAVVMPPLPLLVAQTIGGEGAIVLYEGEIRELQISLVNAGVRPVVEAVMTLSGKQQEHVVSIGHSELQKALPLQPGESVVVPIRLKAGQLVADAESTGQQATAINFGKTVNNCNGPFLVIHYAGPWDEDESSNRSSDDELPPGRRLTLPLQMHILRGLCLVHARLLSMEVPSQISRTHAGPHAPISHHSGSLVKIDPYRGSWGLRLLELELWNPTDVVFEITVCVRKRDSTSEETLEDGAGVESLYPNTRIDRDYSARVLIPLERLKLPVLDKIFFTRAVHGKDSVKSERKTRAEFNAMIKELSSRICVRWNSGKNSTGELAIRDAIREALQASAIDVLLPDPLTFGFRVAANSNADKEGEAEVDDHPVLQSKESQNVVLNDARLKSSFITYELTHLEMLVRNNTRETISTSLSVTCRDVAGENCLSGNKATVLFSGVLNGVDVEVPPLGEIVHTFALCFLVPGEYTLLGAAVLHEMNENLQAQVKGMPQDATREPYCCSGPPFRLQVTGAT